MKKIILLITMILLPIASFAKGNAYGNTEWGMTPSQVIEAEKGKAIEIPPVQYLNAVGKVKIDGITISTGTYTANFIFDDKDHLIQTNVVSNEQNNRVIAASQFNELHRLLTQKYGEPVFKSLNKITWKTKDTTIELSHTYVPNSIVRTSIRYVPNTKIEQDTSNL
ncbi:hypothetical protein JUNP543_1076 [Acinetobacter baumannii]|uniref:hypothetical protein n=1 Tax=Acinetobacter calcoaceticus/baumannii complex TaxID=909768 RepID=UPI0004516B0C|nr:MULTISPECIES: hypothetical protein [Acinetobacter calcoaceticus/baumannii complex]EXR27118.1 hypothetical protein J694_2972 [Acinetobacter sp. 1281984]MBK0410106.1 hypothetical protein [Acinetobacter pittii]MBK1416391.1 hypothetical protein [Acinetobacter pittii]MEE1860153.1 hypothetical protein [Acinetobacter baumannii]QPF41851.1 hypothetical protein H0S59_04375 [Acinetobacter nosocomialis]